MNVIEKAQALIQCASVTPEEGGALDLLEQWLTPLGFVCERMPFEGDGSYAVDNLYARLGTGAPHLCFAGHTDVVPVGDDAAWTKPPFGAEIDDGWLYGRGAEDMKAAIAAFVQAVEDVGVDGTQGSVSLLITGDEEADAVNGTVKMLEHLSARGERWDGCIVGEPTNPTELGQMAKIGRRGSMGGWIEVRGKQGHVAYPHLADNPITRLSNIIAELKAVELDEGTEFFPPSNLEITTVEVGNEAGNVIPATARARFNIRFNDSQTPEALEAHMRTVMAKHAKDVQLDYRVSAQAFLTLPGELSNVVVKAVQDVTGKTPELTTTGGTSDARYVKDVCPVVEFGTTGMRAHQVDERVRVADVKQLSQIYGRIIQGFCLLK